MVIGRSLMSTLYDYVIDEEIVWSMIEDVAYFLDGSDVDHLIKEPGGWMTLNDKFMLI